MLAKLIIIDKRISKHNKGLVRSTKYRLPLKLVYKEEFFSRREAIKRERYFKSLEGGNYIKRILKEKDL